MKNGIKCSYVLVNAVSYIMKEVRTFLDDVFDVHTVSPFKFHFSFSLPPYASFFSLVSVHSGI